MSCRFTRTEDSGLRDPRLCLLNDLGRLVLENVVFRLTQTVRLRLWLWVVAALGLKFEGRLLGSLFVEGLARLLRWWLSEVTLDWHAGSLVRDVLGVEPVPRQCDHHLRSQL